jgi:Caspase domain
VIRRLASALLGLSLLALTARARAETRLYVVAVGNDAPPSFADVRAEQLPTLRFADDDAAAFLTLLRPLSHASELLTVLDAPSQARFPTLAPLARPPTLEELRRVVKQWKARLEDDRRAGHDPVVLFFFSGPGARAADGAGSLVFLDGPMTRAMLYDEILAELPARYIHLIVDACYAESVVRPRDAEAASVALKPSDLDDLAARTTLARFPNVGALMASSTSARTFEWDALERGVFTHALLSGLRGAADVNGDRRIEYSEIYAFLSAAHRDVADARARLSVIARPPSIDRRSPLLVLPPPSRGQGTLLGAPPVGRFFVEDALGNRILDANAERGVRLSLAVPSGRLFLTSERGEASFEVAEGERVDLAKLAFAPARMRARGAVEEALQKGLFASPFGPRYYSAFIEGRDEFRPIPLPPPGRDERAPSPSASRPVGFVLLGAGAILGAATAGAVGLTLSAKSDYQSTSLERDAADARDRFDTFRAMSVVGGVLTLAAVGAGVWLLTRD